AQVPRGTREEVAEAFRALRTSLYVSNNLAPPASTAIVSATAKAGKSFTAIRFAEAVATGFSQQGVVLVDGDCRRPVLHERLHTRRTPGLTDALQGASVASVLVDVMSPSGQPYHLMPSGTTVDDPVALLSGPRFARLVASLGDARAPVIIDTPPVGLFTDPLAIAAMCDATVLVIDARTSRKRQVVRTVESLRRSGATLAGVIVNRTRPDRSSRYYEEGAGTDGKARPRTIRRPADLS
ncbi:MAG: CpsD/CapB family tyrosine-protein kinase, partial [Acidimicrobiales bacterium]|nr:CpsD/CapB family tyrosine-protein kinase [Acidimicrobiales bacterium]